MAITRAQQVRQMYKKGSMEPVKQINRAVTLIVLQLT